MRVGGLWLHKGQNEDLSLESFQKGHWEGQQIHDGGVACPGDQVSGGGGHDRSLTMGLPVTASIQNCWSWISRRRIWIPTTSHPFTKFFLCTALLPATHCLLARITADSLLPAS